MIMEEIIKHVPGAAAKYVEKNEDPRDYRVNFDKIRDILGFKITKTVPDGIKEIYKLVQSGIIVDTFSQKFRNI